MELTATENGYIDNAQAWLDKLGERHSIVKHSDLDQLLKEREQLLQVEQERNDCVEFLKEISPVIKFALASGLNPTDNPLELMQTVMPQLMAFKQSEKMDLLLERIKPLLDLNTPAATALPEQTA